MNHLTEKVELPDILVVDDDSTVVISLHKILNQVGRIRFASDAGQAYKLISENKPKLILLDVQLPGQNGLSICQQLKQNTDTQDIPVIFITGYAEEGFEEQAFDAGAADYIVKPLKPREVTARVETHLAYHQALELLKNQQAG